MSKFKNSEDIDKIISAVSSLMIHGPCGVLNPKDPCMQNRRCTKHFPKQISDVTTHDDDGYPLYRRKDSGRVIKKGKDFLDNRYVVPHNPYLMKRYKAQTNVEWCNQSRSIKYLFKYVNKGNDCVTASFYQDSANNNPQHQDEIKVYYGCREPAIERLPIHFPDEQVVVFANDEPIESILDKRYIHQSKFVAWMLANRKYPEVKTLKYAQFPTKFVWKQPRHEWSPRKKEFAVVIIHFVTPGSGEIYYLRMSLNIAKCPSSYEELRTINNVRYPTFKDACYAIGLLDDDNEYIDRIGEASEWGTSN